MHDENDRYTRQRRLREIGDAGQERLFSASAGVAAGETAFIEFVYLHRAGVGSVAISLTEPRAFAHRAVFRHAAARRHAAAAWRALRTLLELVGGARSHSVGARA